MKSYLCLTLSPTGTMGRGGKVEAAFLLSKPLRDDDGQNYKDEARSI